MSNGIERVAAELQRLPGNVRWLAANMTEIIETTAGIARRRGRREALLHRIVAITGWLALEGLFADAATTLFLFGLWLLQYRVPCRPAALPLFVGIRALREPELERRFEGLVGRSCLSLDERDIGSFLSYGRVSLWSLLRIFGGIRRDFWTHLKSYESLGPLPRRDTIVFFIMHAYRYTYFRAWFRGYLRAPGSSALLACTAVSSAAFAAIAEGAEATYMLHGFQRYALVYADFAQCLCFTGFEAAHMRRRLPNCAVEVDARRQELLQTQRIAAVAGIFWEPDGFDRIRPFIEWARGHDLQVVVRKHPFDRSEYWLQWRGVGGVTVLEGEGTFESFLETERPRFLATWHSTVLFDALLKGVVPITVNPDEEGVHITVYPIGELALCWPRDRVVADQLVDDEDRRHAVLSRWFSSAMEGAETPTSSSDARVPA
jgi:hypothetical protein